MPNNMEQQVDKCIQLVSQFYSNIVDPSERMWIKYLIEYLQFIFANLQQQAEQLYTYDLTVGALESIIDVINANLVQDPDPSLNILKF